ncbi:MULTISPECIES: hypothetical protein [Heyndrickxia]|uniref:hypothetical protein n=1 Tax=Heyndrickxia TaxID=2837504 RepID=UPI0013D54834|nr:hypothetical protein [Heyndrickxia shackletonii]NEZ01014.1 hypothetical protein [Heyndrickxia shackletonii]
MKSMSKKNKILILLFIIILLCIAGLFDIKYKGFFYRLLPNSIQSYLADIF